MNRHFPLVKTCPYCCCCGVADRHCKGCIWIESAIKVSVTSLIRHNHQTNMRRALRADKLPTVAFPSFTLKEARCQCTSWQGRHYMASRVVIVWSASACQSNVMLWMAYHCVYCRISRHSAWLHSHFVSSPSPRWRAPFQHKQTAGRDEPLPQRRAPFTVWVWCWNSN